MSKHKCYDKAPPSTQRTAQESLVFIEYKVILVIDKHASHREIDALNYEKENDIEMVYLIKHMGKQLTFEMASGTLVSDS